MNTRRRDQVQRYGPLGLILTVYLLLGCLYVLFTPTWQAPDEPAHYNYLRQVATSARLPVLLQGDYDQAYLEAIKAQKFPDDMSIDRIRYEGHQPPLYYWLASPVYRLTSHLDISRSVQAIRLLGVVLGAGVVILVWASSRRLFPSHPHIATLAAGFAAFLPMHLAMMASINNDTLAELLIALGVYRLLGHLKHGEWRARAWVVTGIVVGLGMLTKFQAYILLPMTGIVWLYDVWRCRQERECKRSTWLNGVGWLLPPLLLPLAWWRRNTMVYGLTDPLGLYWHDAVVVGQPRTAEWIAANGWGGYLDRYVSFTFKSFWGVFGWLGAFMDGRVYSLLFILSVLVVVGMLWQLGRYRLGTIKLSEYQKRGLVLLVIQLLIVLLTYLWYNLGFVQHQGRYLFPALVPISIAFAIGLNGLFSPQGSRWGAIVAIGLVAIMGLLGLATGGPDKWALLMALLAAIVLGLHSRFALLPQRLLTTATLVLLIVIDLYALFGVVVPQLG
ncbi:MAG: glycosyltransferase family 39 protein [Chloroflexi bacterium]|nr:glycosyltransferase family 39 protein [Chloroflexota bacterium]